MEYYIEPAVQTDEVQAQLAAITPTSIEPESIKVLDPACGSGHILVEAYNVLKAIYEERGYRSRDIPKLILENNIFGLDIDDRAAQLAGFALMMMARNDDRRIFSREIKLNVLSLQESGYLDLVKVWQDLNLNKDVERGSLQLFDDVRARSELDKVYSADSRYVVLGVVLDSFTQAKTFGSLIDVPMEWKGHLRLLINDLERLADQGEPIQKAAAKQILPLVRQAWVLAQRYDAVIANPPYMGSKGINGTLKDFAKKQFPDSKSDLFAMFIERGFGWCKASGFNAQVTMQSWMFLSSYEAMREKLLSNHSLISLLQMPYDGKGPTAMGINFGVTSFVFKNTKINDLKGYFDCFRYFELTEHGLPQRFPSQNERNVLAKPDDFKKISGSPVAFWVGENILNAIGKSKKLGEISEARMGLATGNNAKYVRLWTEVALNNIGFLIKDRYKAKESKSRWFPYSKGGDFRKWYGNNEYVVDWYNDGEALQTTLHPSGARIWAHNFNLEYIFKDSLTWSDITSGFLSVRYNESGFLFDGSGTSAFFKNEKEKLVSLGMLNTQFSNSFSKVLNPTLHFQTGDFCNMPYNESLFKENFIDGVKQLVSIAKIDWNNYETSWDFTENTLIRQKKLTVKAAFEQWQTQNHAAITEMKRLEEENNRLGGVIAKPLIMM